MMPSDGSLHDNLPFTAFANSAPYHMGLFTIEGTQLYVNPAGMSMVGRAGDNAREGHLDDFFSADSAEWFHRHARPAAVEHGTWDGEVEFLHKDGHAFPVSLTATVIHSPKPPHLLATLARDLTDQKRSDVIQRLLKQLADGTPDFIGMADVERRAIYVNPGGMALVGKPGADFRQMSISDFLTPAAKKQHQEEIMPAAMAKGIWAGTAELLHADGHPIPVSRVVVVLRDALGKPVSFATIARDLTEVKRLENALRDAIREMSTPILEIWDGVLALPIIGVVDSNRAAQIMQALLDAVARTQSRISILDLTGVGSIDTSTIDHLLKIVSAAALLGNLCVLSGISGPVAQKAVDLAVDLSHLRTFRSLRHALEFAMQHAGPRPVERNQPQVGQ